MIKTVYGEKLKEKLMENYFSALVNNFFKILPMWENEEHSLHTYIRSLQSELTGGNNYIEALQETPSYASLLFILQFFIDNPDAPIADVKREVFKAIGLCNKLKDAYAELGVEP